MKHLKLFFALFAMLALGVGNAWAEELEVIETLNLSVSTTINATPITVGGVLSITGTKGTNNFPVFNYNSTKGVDLRFYQGTSCSVTFTAKEGYKLEQIVFKKNTSTASTLSNISVNSGTLNSNVWTASESTESVTFTYNSSSNFKEQIYKIYVTYSSTSSGGTEPPTPTTQYTIKWHTAKGVTTDVSLNEGATITKPATDPTMTGYEFMGWTEDCEVASDGTGFTAISNFGTADSDKDYYAVFAMATTTGGESTATEVTDVLNRATTGVTNTSYATWSGKTATSSAVYAGQSAGGNESIQLRTTNSNSGIVTTTSGGKATKISVVWNSNTSSGRTIDIYGKNSAYSQATDLYDSTNQGTKLGSIKYGTSTELAISGDYEYIGIRSNSGALYLTSVSITWAAEGTSGGTTTYSGYITTCSTQPVPSLTTDQFSWSATTATATLPNTFDNPPTLTNTESLAVSYSSSKGEVATIDENGIVALVGKGETVISATAGDDETYKKTTVSYTLTVKPAPLAPIAGGVIDILNQAWTGVTGTNYTDVAAKTAENDGHSNAQYVAQCAGGNSSIQLRSNNNNSGVVSTISGGIVKRVEVEWQNETTAGRILQVYGSNTAYEAATDLYSDEKKGKLLGEIEMGGDETVVDYSQWTGDYKYIGLRSKSGAMYLTTITITWLPINSKVTIDDAIQNGSISVSGAADLNAVAAGTMLTLDNTSDAGYKFVKYNVYKTDEPTTEIDVENSKFIMPEFDVTISATFELAKTLTSIEITNAATQTTFWQGETFNHDGLKVTAHFEGAADEDVTDKVTVAGSTDVAGSQTVTVSYAEGTTIKTTTYTINVKAIPNTKETAYTVADAYDIIDKLTTAEGVYIKGIVSQVDEYLSNYKSITYWISDDGTTTKQLQAYSGKGLNGADFADINGISVDDQVIICGDLKKHTDGTYEFNYDNYLVDRIKTTKADPELSYTTTEYDVNLGDAFTAPTLNNPHTLPVTYSSSNEDVATVATDGAVTIKAAGTVTITASFAGNDDYIAKEASYTINITDPNLLEVTFDATQDLDANNTERGEGKIIKAPITFACTDGILGSSTYGHYRIYANAKATFSAAEGYIITKVVLTSTASNTSSNGPAHLSTEEGTYTYSDKVGTWVGEAYTVTLSASAQVRATLITVYYKQDNRVAAGLAWNPAAVNLTIGDAFTAPTFSNPNSVTGITFTSDNEALATVTNAGVISLVSGKTGIATITATYAGNETYKAAEITCVITVSPKSEKVVILAEYNGQWYAMKAQYVTDKTSHLAPLPVNYVGGKLYNVNEADKALIEWELAVVEGKATFYNDGKYLTGKSGDTDLTLATTACEWTISGNSYLIGARTFLYNAENNWFRNFGTSNAGNKNYSEMPTVTAPVYATGDAYGRTVTTGEYGTICIPYGSSNYTGAEFYEISWMEMDGTTPKGIWLDQVNGALTAGKPYIFKATADEIAIVGNGTTAASPIAGVAGLVGTFALIQDLETTDPSNKLEGNYMISGNQFLLCPAGCWLNANRAYIDASIIAGHTTKKAEIPGRRRVCLGETSENEATGFENIVAPEGQAVKAIVNGQLIIIRDGVKYNVQGQKL